MQAPSLASLVSGGVDGGDGVDKRGASRSRPRRTGRRFEQLGKVRREHVAWKRMGSTVRLLVSW